MVDKVKNITNYGYIIKNSGEFVLIESIEMAFDLFEARRAEREKEQSFRSLFYHNNTIMFIVDPDTLCIIDANEAAVKYYGHEYSELVQMCLKDISIMPEHTIRGNVDESFRQTQNHFIVKHQIKSGEIRDVEVYSGPIYIDNSILLYITIYDITEKLEAVERFKNLFNFAPIGIFVTNSSGEIIDINNKMLDLLGYKHEEIQHLSALDIYNNPKERKELLDALIEHRRVENFQYLLKKKNNQTVYVSITARISKKLKNGDFIIEGFIEEVK
jgi:PAS domain S-box-containing protein